MKKNRCLYTSGQLLFAVTMIVALLWLTVSLPYVYRAQQHAITWSSSGENNHPCQPENPFADTTEEKALSGTSFSEEYLHDRNDITGITDTKLNHFHGHHYDIYVAFHGELISPPPDHFLS